MDLRIRDATPGDTRFLAWVIQEAARSHLPRGFWDVAVPEADRRSDFLTAMTTAEPPCFTRWAGFIVAEVDGRQAAALCAYEPRLHRDTFALAQAAAIRTLGWSEQDGADFGTRMQSLGDPWIEIPDERWVIEWVATVPEFRGRGIVHELLERILERGREHGYRGAQIGHLIGNEPARRAYQRVGFTHVDEKRDPDFEAALGSPGLARMHLDLV